MLKGFLFFFFLGTDGEPTQRRVSLIEMASLVLVVL